MFADQRQDYAWKTLLSNFPKLFKSAWSHVDRNEKVLIWDTAGDPFGSRPGRWTSSSGKDLGQVVTTSCDNKCFWNCGSSQVLLMLNWHSHCQDYVPFVLEARPVVEERWTPFGSGLFAFLTVGRVQGCLATCDGWVQAQHADGSVKPNGKNVVKRPWWELMFQQLLKCHLHIHAYPCAFLPVQIYNFPKNFQTKPHAVGFLYGKHCTLRLWPLHWLA